MVENKYKGYFAKMQEMFIIAARFTKGSSLKRFAKHIDYQPNAIFYKKNRKKIW
jgi:hypothetical protein